MKMSNFMKIIKKYPDPEWEDRQNRSLVRLIKKAKFRYPASIEETDFSLDRNLSHIYPIFHHFYLVDLPCFFSVISEVLISAF